MKLREFLQQQWLSRRNITAAIDAGSVFLNNKKVDSYGELIDNWDVVKIQDKTWKYIFTSDNKKSEFLVVNKPIGYVCSKSDPHNTIIYQLLPKQYHNRYYLGRLDKDSRGLVLMTNDPKMVDQYEHPRYGITKEYLVTLNKSFRQEDIQRCLSGLEDDKEGILKCIECHILNDKTYEQYKKYLLPDMVKSPSCVIRMVLNEGKKRHIRRMMSAMKYHVEDLIRIREGDVKLDDLKEGEIKVLSQ